MRGLGLLVLATMATDDPDLDEDSTRNMTCRKCGEAFTTTDGLEPCPLCNTCAVEISQILGEAILRLYAHMRMLPAIVRAPIEYALEHGPVPHGPPDGDGLAGLASRFQRDAARARVRPGRRRK